MSVARINDRHTGMCDHGIPFCCPHSVQGVISTGSPTTQANNLSVARLGDSVIHNCPHCGTGHISTGSSNTLTDGMPTARLGDSVTYPGGSGVIVTASPDIEVV